MQILLVDDDEDDRDFAQDAFLTANPGAEMSFLQDGQALIDYLTGHRARAGRPPVPAPVPKWPDLILLDLNMPRMSGNEALAAIRADASLRFLPVVVFATSTTDADVSESYRLGASSFIAKPASFAAMVEAMRSFHTYWCDTATTPRESLDS